ncbi:hypothetical protein, partial [Klebsiella pneumoniae]|uniref:hypothetical protein n=1 Tax=Klebsiella pneumoniae TaxID=573 RepID=UPI001C8F96EF
MYRRYAERRTSIAQHYYPVNSKRLWNKNVRDLSENTVLQTVVTDGRTVLRAMEERRLLKTIRQINKLAVFLYRILAARSDTVAVRNQDILTLPIDKDLITL